MGNNIPVSSLNHMRGGGRVGVRWSAAQEKAPNLAESIRRRSRLTYTKKERLTGLLACLLARDEEPWQLQRPITRHPDSLFWTKVPDFAVAIRVSPVGECLGHSVRDSNKFTN